MYWGEANGEADVFWGGGDGYGFEIPGGGGGQEAADRLRNISRVARIAGAKFQAAASESRDD